MYAAGNKSGVGRYRAKCSRVSDTEKEKEGERESERERERERERYRLLSQRQAYLNKHERFKLIKSSGSKYKRPSISFAKN